jgi:DNA processing protein
VDETLDLLTIALLPAVGPRTARDLAARAPLAEVLARPRDHADVLSPDAIRELLSGQARGRARAEWARAPSRDARIVGWDEPDYPEWLRRIYDPPPVLWVRGRLEPGEGTRSVGVVGSRAATPQGQALAHALARDLAAAGATIVSGLARGIDTAAHRGALAVGGRSVAVLGSALDCLYPRANAGLAVALAERGAVVSELPFGTGAQPGTFPRRNRILAGWGRGVVVVEAAEKSGALITARCALDEGREVLAVPGFPGVAGAQGTNRLIRDGAALVRDATDVAAELGFEMPVAARVAGAATTDPVLGALRPDVPASVPELQERSGKPVAELLARLAELELASQVRRLPGALFVRQ